jgi:ferredoxin-NAD(P)+ reductase (naphthalene dioxygenase ferredoxin-specific)
MDWPNESTLALQLRPNRSLDFTAGQFVRLDFGTGLVRPYSMANAEGSEMLEFHLRRVPGGRVTGFAAEQLRCGDTVKVVGPLGTSYLRRTHQGPMLCIAGGTGLAPITSIVRTAASGPGAGPIHIYVGARTEADLYGIAALSELKRQYPTRLTVDIAVDARPSDPSVRHGLITDIVAADLTSLARWKVYLAGPPPMVEAGTRLALRLGAQRGDIHADAFYPAES